MLGCESTQRFYAGHRKPAADVATVKMVLVPTGARSLKLSVGFARKPGFIRVDGSRELPGGKELNWGRPIELLPGNHRIEVRWVWNLGETLAYPAGPTVVRLLGGGATLSFDAEAGHQYAITWLEEEPWKERDYGFKVVDNVIVPATGFIGKSYVGLEDTVTGRLVTRGECIPDSR